MSGYIEKDETGEYFNPISTTVAINPDDKEHQCYDVMDDTDENLKRWNWLISGWSQMSFQERMSIFLPKTHYLNLGNFAKVEFDNKLNAEILEKSYEWCRNLLDIRFKIDRQGIPNILLIYKPININIIPNEDVKIDIISWGRRHGFID